MDVSCVHNIPNTGPPTQVPNTGFQVNTNTCIFPPSTQGFQTAPPLPRAQVESTEGITKLPKIQPYLHILMPTVGGTEGDNGAENAT